MEDEGGFDPGVFRARRERVFGRLGEGALVLPAAETAYRSRDTEYRYRPDSELFYVTGLTGPGAVAVLRGHAGEDRFVLFVRARDEEAELWHGPRADPEELGERAGADVTYPLEELEERLPGLLVGAEPVYFRLDADARCDALVRRALASSRLRGAREGRGPRGVVDPGAILDELRLRKEPGEVERIREAARITARAYRHALGRVRPGMGEWELEAALEATFRTLGADGPAYESIVGSGPNACVLHYVENRRVMDSDDLVLVDAAAAVALYAADVTRTFPVAGSFTPEQRAVYEMVEEARAAAVAAVRPGTRISDVHRAAIEVVLGGLVEAGVLEGELDELVESEAHKPYFPHRTSHWLGLDVHDPGDYVVEGESRVLEPGMVLTVEPGLYFRSGAGHHATPFSGIGVRIEDDLLVTEDGFELLSRGLPTDPEALTELVGGGGED